MKLATNTANLTAQPPTIRSSAASRKPEGTTDAKASQARFPIPTPILAPSEEQKDLSGPKSESPTSPSRQRDLREDASRARMQGAQMLDIADYTSRAQAANAYKALET